MNSSRELKLTKKNLKVKDSFFESSFAKNSRFHWDFIKEFKDYEKWELLAEQYKSHKKVNFEKRNNKSKIPKKIHQIWIGPKALPKKYIKWMRSWEKFNSDWEYILWTDKEIKNINFMNQENYDISKNIGFKSDLARYEILNNYGGLYVDTDLECIKTIPESLLYYDFVSCIVFRNSPVINNAIILSKPQSKLIQKLRANIKLQINNNSALETLNCSGPFYLTKQYFSLEKKDLKNNLILPSNYFYPFPNFLLNQNIEVNKFITKETIGIHYWEVSWMKGSIAKRIVIKFFKIFRKLLHLLKEKLNIFFK